MITNAVTLEQGVTVTQLKGQIYLVAADGSRKLLAEGDVLPKGAVIMSPDGASFMGGGQSFNVQPASEQSEPAEEGDAPQLAQNGAAGTPDDISALQQAILGGADPTQAFEASAAGGAPAAGGGGIGGVAGASGNGGFVTIDRTGSATIAEATFDTTYNTNGEPPLEAVGEDDPLFTSANLVLSADVQVNEGGFITFTATLDEPVFGSDLVIQLSNGAVIIIPVGQSSGSVTVAAPADSPYVDPSTISVSITGTQGGGFNQIITGPSTTTQINDTVDTTTVTLGAPAQVNEGGQITYSANVNNAPQSDLVLTLSNGASITIKAGELSGSVTVDAPSDDVYKDGSSLTVSITGSSGGNYEQLDTSSKVTTDVVDTVDTTTVTLSSATNGQTVIEGGSIVYTASVSNPVTGSPLAVTLSNGVVITIPVGSSSANSEPVPVRGDDIYQQGEESLSVTIDKTSGGNYESVVTTGTITNTVVDDQDAPTLTLTGDANVVEGGKANYTLNISDAPKTDLTVKVVVGHITTDNGDVQAVTREAVIKAGTTSVSFDVATLDDVYAEPAEQFQVSVSETSGGGYEKAPVLPGAVTTTVTDEPNGEGDKVSVTIESNGDVTEAQQPVFTVKVSQALDHDLTVTLSNGDSVVIPKGETSVPYSPAAQGDDVFKDGDTLTVGLSDATVAGKSFENLELGGNATVTISDTENEVVATLSADKSTVSEGGEVTYTVTLTNKDGLPVSGHKGLSFTLSNGQSITIAAGQTSGSVKLTAGDDVYSGGQKDLNVKLTGVSGGDDFEKLTLGKETVTTTVTDEPNGEGDKATVLLSGPASVFEGSLTGEYTVTLSHAAKPGDKVLLSYSYTTASGDDIVETKEAVIGVDGKTAKFTIATVNDVRIEGSENFAVSVSKVLNAAGQDVFEGLDTSAAKVTTTIVDNDSVVSLQAVVEGTTGNVLNVADGVAFTGATALGGTVSLVNGKYVYQAPVRDHADLVADTDSFTYTKADGSTVTYTINILDTNPIAAKDSGSVAVGLNVQTSGSASLLANDTVVDSSSANPAKVYSVTGLNGQAMVLDHSGSVTVAGKYGDLTVSAEGSYTYTSKLDTDVQAVEGGPAVKSAFAVYGFQNNSLPLNGTSLNLTGLTDSATALVDVRTSGNNAKPGIGVSQSGGGTNDIGSGESLVIGLKALSNFAQIGINELNSGQGSASWKAYDANGVLVGSGILVSSSSNGGLQSFNISTNTPFQYLVLGYSGNQNGYVVDSIKYTPAIGAVTEEFTYTVKDNDGDVSNSAVLTLNGNVPTTVAPTMLMGVEDTDVTMTWASFGISDNASTVRISGNQDGTGTIRYLDASTNQYKELGKNETKTFTKADIDSGKVKFDPEDNVSGADVYGNDKGVGNKGHDLTSIKFDVLKGNQVIASDKSVVVDLTPKADAPTLKVGTFSSLAAMDFENVGVGTGGWKDNINPNSINGAGAIGQWHANGSGLIEVGKESVYLGNKATSTTNQVMEIESSRNVSQLYTDIQCESGRFYQLNFDISARTTPQNIDISSCGLKVFLVQLDANGRQIPESRIDLYDFSPKSVGWLKGVPVPLKVPETGTYRLVFESKDASGNGDSYGAVLDNVKFQAVDNKGYEDSFIKLGKIDAELVDRDGSERLSVEIEGLPVGAVLKDAANHIVIVKDDTHKVDVTGWSLSTLQLKVNDPGHYNLVVKATAKEVTSSGTVLDSAVSKVILPVEVLAANATPVITATSVAVSEEGLSGGLIDTTDFRGQDTNLDSTNATSVSGKLAISDANGDIIQSVKLVEPTERITSGGSDIKWTVSADGMTLTGKVGNNGPTAVTVTIDKQGNYNVTLFKSLDHVNADNVEGRLEINVGVEASDGKATGTGTLTIQVEDDRPVVVTPQTAHIEGAGIQTNLMLIVDVSGSMDDGSGVPAKTRLDIAKESLLSLLNTYDGLGTTKVRIVTFSNDGDDIGERWMTVSAAKNYIWSLRADGGTNYMGAIEKSISAFADPGKLVGQGVQNISYFLSDGEPWHNYGVPEEQWINFLKANNIKSYSLGMGSQVSQSALDLAAYDGVGERNTDAIVVTDMSKLEQVISGTAQRSVSGDLFGQPGTGGGADGGVIRTVRIDGHNYTIENGRLVSGAEQGGRYDVQSQQLLVTFGNGDKLTIGLVTGEYLYQTSQHGAQSKIISFDLVDADGDKVTGSLNLTIDPLDNGRTFAGNDGDDHLTVLNTSQVHIALGGVHGGAPQTMTEQNIDTRSGVTLYGGKGNDHLTGGLGDDILSGGTNGHGSSGAAPGGSGKLYYGDLLTGGNGADTFLWQQGDGLEQGAVGGNTPSHAIDYITDFHVDHLDTTTGYGDNGWYKINQFKDVDIVKSDKLDLSDLLDHDGSKQEADLTKLLSVFESGTDVHIQVRASEGSSVVSQEIVLLNTTFESITGDSNQVYDSSTSSASEQVINYMLQNHLLDIDK
ncbi:retention module-containing protein [Aeromonas veronii]|uniref:retention module-containing protein n=2 Tax=Aeromonas veronii TaxID=654 RepID=UPI00191E3BDD|nr:retention module-containing protein [Aeromonas veronii]MBL0590826.1 retention module-containing protein [Aeromonas veronii]